MCPAQRETGALSSLRNTPAWPLFSCDPCYIRHSGFFFSIPPNDPVLVPRPRPVTPRIQYLLVGVSSRACDPRPTRNPNAVGGLTAARPGPHGSTARPLIALPLKCLASADISENRMMRSNGQGMRASKCTSPSDRSLVAETCLCLICPPLSEQARAMRVERGAESSAGHMPILCSTIQCTYKYFRRQYQRSAGLRTA